MQKRYTTCFSFSVTVKTVIEANSIRELRAKIRHELREPNSYLTIPSSLVYDPNKLNYQRKPSYKHYYPSDDDYFIESELENAVSAVSVDRDLRVQNMNQLESQS